MRRIIPLVGFFFLLLPKLNAAVISSTTVKTIYNPYTGRFDFITVLDTSSIQGGSNITVVKTSSGVSISGTGSGGSPGGSPPQIQINGGAVFLGTATLTMDTTSNLLTVGATTTISKTLTTSSATMNGTLVVQPSAGSYFEVTGTRVQAISPNGNASMFVGDTSASLTGPGGNAGISVDASNVTLTDNNLTNQIQILAATGVVVIGSTTLQSYNCTGNLNSGKITTDSAGVLRCDDDISGSGASIYPATGTVILPKGVSVSTLTFSGVPTYPKKRVYISASAGMCQSIETGGCLDAVKYQTTTSSTVYFASSFTANTTMYWQAFLPMPTYYVAAGSFTATILFIGTATTTSTNWNIDMKALHPTDANLDAAWGTAVQTTKVVTTAGNLEQTPESTSIIPANSPIPGDLVYVRVYRGNPGDVAFVGMWLTFPINQFSTETQ